MMAAAKRGSGGHLKKKRSDPNRPRRPDRDPSLPETRRSLRPRQIRYLADFEDELDLEDEEQEEEEEREARGRRKLKLVLKLPSVTTARCRDSSPVSAPKSRRIELDRKSPSSDFSPSTSRSATSGSRSEEEDEEEEEEEEIVKPLKKRRIERVADLDRSGHREESKRSMAKVPIRAVSGTPMPEKSELEAALDKLQKKDTYGVFAEPVDPDELPDYHDVIEHPMDFGTVRRKLANGRYRSFEQFEDDVFLICSNAMQYNAPDTIYFRQAHSIQDMARKNFQEIRADQISRVAVRKSEENMRSIPERKSEVNIKSASNEKKRVKKLQSGIAPRPSGSEISSLEKKIPKHPCRNTFEPLGNDVSSMEKKTIKKQYRTAPELPRSDSIKKSILKTPQHRAAPGSGISSMEKKSLKKHQGTASESRGPDVSFEEEKTLKKLQNRTTQELRRFDVSSVEKKTIKRPQYRTVLEPPGSDMSSIERKTKKPQFRTAPEPLDSDISSRERKKVKKPHSRSTPEPLGSDVSSMENMTVKNSNYKTEDEQVCSDISSQDKKMETDHQSRTAPEPLGSDISSGATLASATDRFAGFREIPAEGKTSTTEPCTGFSKAEASEKFLAEDNGLTAVKASSVDRSVAINGPADGSSSLGETKSEKADEGQAKCSPCKLGQKQFVVDANRRNSYNTWDDDTVDGPDSVFDIFEGETRQLVEQVGLNIEYSYARSLARFASSLGPIGWEIASKKIEQALPPGVKFGRGWVGEYEPLLTPVLVLESSTQQPQSVKEKDKRNEMKPEVISTISRKEKGNEPKSSAISSVSRKDKRNETKSEAIRNGQWKDMPFGLNSQMMTGMPSSRKINPSNEGSERTQEKKRGLFGVNLELQTCTNRMTMQQQQQSPSVVDLARAYSKETSGNRFDICFEAAKATPALVSRGWNPVQIDPQQQQQQQQKNHMAQLQTGPQNPQQEKSLADFSMAYSNETTRNRPEFYSDVHASNSLAVSYSGRSQVQSEQQKQLEAVKSQRRNDGLGINCGGLGNLRSNDGRQSAPFGIISNQQAGVQYWLARGSHEQAINDPLRWMSSPGNQISNQPSTPNRSSNNNVDRPVPTVQIPKRENPSAAAAHAWMSFGASAGWKSVDVGGVPNKQAESVAFNPTWKTPHPVSRIHEEAKPKPEPLREVTEHSQVQTKGLVIFPQLMTTDPSRLQSPWQGLVPHNKQKDTLPPDLNISFQPLESPARSSSGISQQPDLALQL